MQKPITPCLWFNNCTREVVDFYLPFFKDGTNVQVDHPTEVDQGMTNHQKNDVVTIEFRTLGIHFIALNTGPEFTF